MIIAHKIFTLRRCLNDNNIKDESDWIYHNIDEIYIEFIKEFNIKNNGYIMFGHSSGGTIYS